MIPSKKIILLLSIPCILGALYAILHGVYIDNIYENGIDASLECGTVRMNKCHIALLDESQSSLYYSFLYDEGPWEFRYIVIPDNIGFRIIDSIQINELSPKRTLYKIIWKSPQPSKIYSPVEIFWLDSGLVYFNPYMKK